MLKTTRFKPISDVDFGRLTKDFDELKLLCDRYTQLTNEIDRLELTDCNENLIDNKKDQLKQVIGKLFIY